MVNSSKLRDPRFWKRWKERGAVGSLETAFRRLGSDVYSRFYHGEGGRPSSLQSATFPFTPANTGTHQSKQPFPSQERARARERKLSAQRRCPPRVHLIITITILVL